MPAPSLLLFHGNGDCDNGVLSSGDGVLSYGGGVLSGFISRVFIQLPLRYAHLGSAMEVVLELV
jgi:hypothetical protein